jgi:hypothetical protein
MHPSYISTVKIVKTQSNQSGEGRTNKMVFTTSGALVISFFESQRMLLDPYDCLLLFLYASETEDSTTILLLLE